MAIEEARETVADALRCSPHEVVFTSGGTEADNLAVKGIVWAARDRGATDPHLVTTAVEHAAVLEPARWLADRGDVDLTVVAPGPDGRVAPEDVLAAVRDDTVLVSVMAANNELGAINDLTAIAPTLQERGVALHSDAVQAFATLPIDVPAWGVDAMALSAHKFGGPQGVGIAVLRRGLAIDPLAHGGGQDRGVRSGTFAAGLIAACGAAARAAADDRGSLATRLRALSDRLAAGVAGIDGVHRDGPVEAADRLASHVHLSIDGIASDGLILALDDAEVAASPGSACGSGAAKPSHVLSAVGIAGTPLRLSLGWTSTEEDVDRAIDVLTDVIPRLRSGAGAPTLSFAPLTDQSRSDA